LFKWKSKVSKIIISKSKRIKIKAIIKNWIEKIIRLNLFISIPDSNICLYSMFLSFSLRKKIKKNIIKTIKKTMKVK
jgi:hypothetical protein